MKELYKLRIVLEMLAELDIKIKDTVTLIKELKEDTNEDIK